MRYVIVERVEPAAVRLVYERFRDRGRLLPDGLEYLDSWVSDDLTRCYQLMECDDESLLDQWVAHWDDLVEFEIVPVISSAAARARVLGPADAS